jgi:hypothetical protein
MPFKNLTKKINHGETKHTEVSWRKFKKMEKKLERKDQMKAAMTQRDAFFSF